MNSTFVRKDFYIDPPENASPEEWREWIKRDDRQAAVHKAAHTRTTTQESEPDSYVAMTTRRIDGIWKQVPVMCFSGNGEDDVRVQPVVEGDQEKVAILTRMGIHKHNRGTKSKGKNARYRKNKKARRKNK